MNIIEILSQEFNIGQNFLNNIINMIDEGNTLPFIARYRKEQTGSIDDQVLRELNDRLVYLRNIEIRRLEVIQSITQQEKMTDELLKALNEATVLARIEDIYRPFKQKRRTRATMAKEKGLEPLALLVMEYNTQAFDVLAQPFLGEIDINEALEGTNDIIAEIISDDADTRENIRAYILKNGIIKSTALTENSTTFDMYYEYQEPIKTIQNHRILAINRGESEKVLKVSIVCDEINTIAIIRRKYIKIGSSTENIIIDACTDSYKRLLEPSIEREIRASLSERAHISAIDVFKTNLKNLIMSPPIKDRICLALDPGYRTGCKVAVCDEDGKAFETGVVYLTQPTPKLAQAKDILTKLIHKYDVSIIAIGNGTASKETEIFAAELIASIKKPELAYIMVNEAGASVYSASKLAAQEFPELDVSLRSAISIARRVQDPLAELVKIDPKSIGVGQYQHDMPQVKLGASLEAVVEDCVNSVGVNLETASPSLLSYVSGITPSLAKNIVKYREENGRFKNRKQLLKVPKLGAKTFQQCAGFLRISGGDILDNTAVHPESYKATLEILKLTGYKTEDITNGNIKNLEIKNKEEIASSAGIGVPTLLDIIDELSKPGRDIRDSGAQPILRQDIMDIKDLKPGMEIVGTVRNVIDFGAFIDIAVHQDGLVHLSQISDKFIKHPSEVLSVGDIVTVWVISVDTDKARIALTMKKPK